MDRSVSGRVPRGDAPLEQEAAQDVRSAHVRNAARHLVSRDPRGRHHQGMLGGHNLRRVDVAFKFRGPVVTSQGMLLFAQTGEIVSQRMFFRWPTVRPNLFRPS